MHGHLPINVHGASYNIVGTAINIYMYICMKEVTGMQAMHLAL